MDTLRVIDFNTNKSFECGGKKFYLKESLGFMRYRELQKINMEFGYSATFQDIFTHIKQAWDLLNATKLGEAAVVLHNIIYGIVSLEEKRDPALRLCALFIDEEGEDPTVYDPAKMEEKIECWGKELDTLPFFQLASNIVPGWMPVYKMIINDGLLEKAKEVPST
jgi:hypothetical protein